MTIALFGILLSFLMQLSAASAAPSPNALDAQLAARGIIQTGGQYSALPIRPLKGSEVTEMLQTSQATGEELARITSWDEALGTSQMHVEYSTMPSGQHQIAFWVLPQEGHSCSIHGWTMYDREGDAIRGGFWRHDAALRIPGARELPEELYPDYVTAFAFLRALDDPHVGGSGTVNSQITPYGYIGLDVWASAVEKVTVPAGKFDALKVNFRVDLNTLYPSMPRVLAAMIEPLVPSSTYYFETQPPYRLVKMRGDLGFQGPKADAELVRCYVAGGTDVRQPASFKSAR